MERYRIFRKDRQGRQTGGVIPYVNNQLECNGLHLGMDEEPAGSGLKGVQGQETL